MYCKDVSFWVPRSSPQKFCSEDCRIEIEKKRRKPKAPWPYARKKRKVEYDLTKEDYYDDEIDGESFSTGEEKIDGIPYRIGGRGGA